MKYVLVIALLAAIASTSFAWKCPEHDDSKAAVYHEHDIFCNKFYECSNGRAYEMSCPPSTYWDQRQKACSSFVDCGSRV